MVLRSRASRCRAAGRRIRTSSMDRQPGKSPLHAAMPFPTGGPSFGRGCSFPSVTLATVVLSLIVLFLSQAEYASAATPFNPYSAAARCPPPCEDTVDHSSWGLYSGLDQLARCNQTVLLDLNLYSGLGSADTVADPVRACTVQQREAPLAKRQLFSFNFFTSSGNGTHSNSTRIEDLEVIRWQQDGQQTTSDRRAELGAAAASIADAMTVQRDGTPTILIAKSGKTVLGIYAGAQLRTQGLDAVVRQFAEREAVALSHADRIAAHLCSSDSLATQILGVIVDATGNLKTVKAALAGWNDAQCLEAQGGDTAAWRSVTLATVPDAEVVVGPVELETTDDSGNLVKRATCSYTQAVAGDGCWSLANRCGITEAQLLAYNGPHLCSTVQVGEYICCSSGDLPYFGPSPNPDGTCYSYAVQTGDTCASIAAAHSISVYELTDWNEMGWGWNDCSYLVVGQKLCLSLGFHPMPAAIPNAICGPQVEGTARPSNWSALAELNPCPLNVCCNVWGQCGLTDDFCIESPAESGAPGAVVPGSNGCISNCNMEIMNNDSPPSTFRVIGYWEAWNKYRPCLHQKARQLDTEYYTHIHFAFGNITEDFKVDVSGLAQEFYDFKALTGVKRIISFGGWSFSTEHDTYPIFRQGVTASQRQLFASNVASFVKAHRLDGVDFDWEYPGAPDIPGIPAGHPDDGTNYLAFLQLVRDKLGSSYEIGIAAPASYWYLKGFPIADISDVVDYIVYMTYDLHGQWDYDNQWATPGCPAGNCLRSHVNKTETELSLAMITHAGVPASKVVFGMALYGRSFQMTTPGCYGQDCTFTGPESGATPGRCTKTAGYLSNFEIREIISRGTGINTLYSDDEGDILVYDDVQWVSYMTRETYASRLAWIRGLNFGGTSDWAADLDADYPSDADPGQGDHGVGPVYVSPDIYDDPDPVISCRPPCTLILPPWVLASPTTITFPPVTVTYRDTWETTVTRSGVGVVTTSAGSTTSTVLTLPPLTTQTIPVSNVVWSPPLGVPTASSSSTDDPWGVIWLTSSIIPPPVTVTQTHTRYPGGSVVWTFSPGAYPTPTPDPSAPGSPTTTGPPPPPPPPPPGHSSTVKVRSASNPSPTCRPLQICGLPCIIGCSSLKPPCVDVCGCIGTFCPRGGGGGGGSGGCVGAGCSDPGPGPGPGPGPDPGPTGPETSSCRRKQTASHCKVDCTVMQYPASSTTRCRDPDCTRTFTACSATDSTTTTTTTYSCPANTGYNRGNLDSPAPLLGDGGEGGWVAERGNFNIPPETITVTDYVTSFVPRTTTSTRHVTVVEEANQVSCAFWDAYFIMFHFNLYGIVDNNGWTNRVEGELRGCGALTDWKYQAKSGSVLANIWFNLPFFIKEGCVERAIVSAGGPKISCKGGGLLWKRSIDAPEGDLTEQQPEVQPLPLIERQALPSSVVSSQTSTPLYVPTPSPRFMTELPNYSYPEELMATATPVYEPMTWGTEDIITMTWTLTSTSTSVSPTTYTTTIPGYTYDPATETSFTASSVSASSSSSSVPPSGPTTSPGNTEYEFHGCYIELSSGRALANVFADDAMTVATCLALGTGFTYVGLQYGRECFWGNTLDPGSLEDSLSACNMPCGGDASTICGAGSRLTLYIRKDDAPSPYVDSVGGYDLVGCYAAPPTGRALSLSYADDDMTPSMCAGVAATASATYFGLEYGRECWYGNSIDSGAVMQSSLDSCDMACAGDATKKCGAGNRLLMYEVA